MGDRQYLDRLVDTLMQQAKVAGQKEFTGLGGGWYTEYFWERIKQMSSETLGRIVAYADDRDLDRRDKIHFLDLEDVSPGRVVLIEIAFTMVYVRYEEKVFGKRTIVVLP